jgi:hypothetical protein
MSTETATVGIKAPEREVITDFVHREYRTWVDLPMQTGFITLDRTEGPAFAMRATLYMIKPEDYANRAELCRLLSDWEGNSYPSRHRAPTPLFSVVPGEPQARFSRRWEEIVPAGEELIVDTFRGQTPVTLVFQTA